MQTTSRPVPPHGAMRHGTGHDHDEPAEALGHRLGLSARAVRAYLAAHGGAPDGVDEARERDEAFQTLVDRRAVTHALPARCGSERDPAWVKRDRPRSFIAG